MITVPAETPVTIPLLAPTVAIPVAPDVHTPTTVSVKVNVDPTHIAPPAIIGSLIATRNNAGQAEFE